MRGRMMSELLKQPQYSPMPVEKEVVILFTANSGYLQEYKLTSIKKYEEELLYYIENNYPEIYSDIREKKSIDDTLKTKILTALDNFKKIFVEA